MYATRNSRGIGGRRVIYDLRVGGNERFAKA